MNTIKAVWETAMNWSESLVAAHPRRTVWAILILVLVGLVV